MIKFAVVLLHDSIPHCAPENSSVLPTSQVLSCEEDQPPTDLQHPFLLSRQHGKGWCRWSPMYCCCFPRGSLHVSLVGCQPLLPGFLVLLILLRYCLSTVKCNRIERRSRRAQSGVRSERHGFWASGGLLGLAPMSRLGKTGHGEGGLAQKQSPDDREIVLDFSAAV